jgi:sorbitol/mannitol transport system substrate-binding protein
VRGPRAGALVGGALVVSTALAGCGASGWGGAGGGGGADTINVLMVNNSQMVDLQKLTADNFTAKTGIKVNYTVLPENDVRDKISQEFSSQAGQYDVATVSNFEIPIYARSKWIAPLSDYIAKDTAFDQDDILKPMTESMSKDGVVYGEPFYGESSFLMYRKDVLDSKGITMPPNPTWDQVAEIAGKVDGAQPNMKGICLRGQPGWTPGVNAKPFVDATNFYVNLVQTHGEKGAPQAGFTECLNNLVQGNAAMWYDATSAAGSLEAADSPVKGKIGYVAAPVKLTKSSGWLYSWAWGIQMASTKKDNAWKFVSWASSKEYEELVGQQLGWSKVPAGKRSSTYDNADYLKVASAFATPTKAAIESADPNNPGVQPRPAPGIQFIDIPEFPDLGTQVSQDVSSAIAGRMSVQEALDTGQGLAEDVADRYQSKAAQ